MVWDAMSRVALRTMDGVHGGSGGSPVVGVGFEKDTRGLVTAGEDGLVVLFDLTKVSVESTETES